MRLFGLAAAVAIAAMPMPVTAQEAEAAELAERLSDPAFQHELSGTVAVMSEILLDLPIAPLAEAAAAMAGEDPGAVDPDMTLRQLAGPDAGRVSGEIAENLPRMMGAMAGMAEGFSAMMPTFREMARRMESEIDRAKPPR